MTDKKHYRNQHLVAIAVNLCAVGLGNAVGWVSPTLVTLTSDGSPLGDPLSVEEVSWTGSIHVLLAILGAVLFGYISNNGGRKLALCLIPLCLMINWILILVATSTFYLFAARSFVGIAAGAVYTVIPVYMVEVAQMEIRGKLGSFQTIGFYFGLAMSYIAGPFLSFTTFPYLLLSVVIFTFVLLVIFIPETPLYLMRSDKEEEAHDALLWLRDSDKKDNEKTESVEEELKQLKSFSLSEIPKISFKDFLTPVPLRGLILSVLLLLFQQLGASFAILSFAHMIFQQAGSSLSPDNATIIVGVLLFFGSIIATTFVERAGRKVLLLSSCFGLAASHITLATFMLLIAIQVDVDSCRWIPVLALSIFAISYTSGLGPLSFLVVSELFSPELRGAAVSFCTFIYFIFGFLIAKFFNNVSSAVGIHVCFYIFGSSMVAAIIFITIFVPETKGRCVQDILTQLSGSKTRIIKTESYNINTVS